MRKFANIDAIVIRQTAKKLGLTVDQYKERCRQQAERQAEIDKAWAEAARVQTEEERAYAQRLLPVKKSKTKKTVMQLNQAPEMRDTRAKKQRWDGIKWVKLVEKEPVDVEA